MEVLVCGFFSANLAGLDGGLLDGLLLFFRVDPLDGLLDGLLLFFRVAPGLLGFDDIFLYTIRIK